MRKRIAFSLVELLVVVSILGILIALLFPAVQAARESARRATCTSNLRQIGLAVLMHHDTKKHLPAAWELTDGDNENGHNRFQESFLVRVLPFLEQANAYVGYNTEVNILAPENAGVIGTTIPIYLCPSMIHDRGDSEAAPGSYVACTGSERPDYPFDPVTKEILHNGAIIIVRQEAQHRLSLKSIVDGTSQTFAAGEFDYFSGSSKSGPQWAGGYVIGSFGATWGEFNPPVSPSDFSQFAAAHTAFRSDHPGGANFLYVDGSVHFVSNATSDATLDAYATRAGGELEMEL